MELDWSEQSPHIRTLFRPWQPGDGYNEADVQEAEARLGVRLPTKLRNFYLAWGKRKDMAEMVDPLLPLDYLEIRGDALLFWVENQPGIYWGISCEAFEEGDPPVVSDSSGPNQLIWEPSYAHLSSFLDDMTYLHALSGGAIHGGYTQPYLPDLPAEHMAWLEDHWSKATVTPWVFGIDSKTFFTDLYVREGQAFWWCGGGSLAARQAETVEEIEQRFQITWARRW